MYFSRKPTSSNFVTVYSLKKWKTEIYGAKKERRARDETRANGADGKTVKSRREKGREEC